MHWEYVIIFRTRCECLEYMHYGLGFFFYIDFAITAKGGKKKGEENS